MKKLLLVIAIFSFGHLFAQEKLVHSSTSYVDDYANILSTETKISLDKKIRDFKTTSKVEFSIVTVESLNGRDIESFTLDLARRWGVGTKANQGVMILIAPKEHLIRTEVGYGLEGDLPDIYVTRQQDNITHFFKENNYDAGITSLLDTYITYLNPTAVEQRKIAEKKDAELAAARWEKTKSYLVNILLILLFIGFITTIIIIYIKRKKEGEKLLAELKQQEIIRFDDAQDKYKTSFNVYLGLINKLQTIKASEYKLIDVLPNLLVEKTFDKKEDYDTENQLVNLQTAQLKKDFKNQVYCYDVLQSAKEYNKKIGVMITRYNESLIELGLRVTEINKYEGLELMSLSTGKIIDNIKSLSQIRIPDVPTIENCNKLNDEVIKESDKNSFINEIIENFTKLLDNKETLIESLKNNPIDMKNSLVQTQKKYGSLSYIIDFAEKFEQLKAIVNEYLDKENTTSDWNNKNSLYREYYPQAIKITSYFYDCVRKKEKEDNDREEENRKKQAAIAAAAALVIQQREDEEEERSNYNSSSNDYSSDNSSTDSGSSFGGGSFGGGGGTSGW